MKRKGPRTLRCRNPLVFNKVSTSSQKGADTCKTVKQEENMRLSYFLLLFARRLLLIKSARYALLESLLC